MLHDSTGHRLARSIRCILLAGGVLGLGFPAFAAGPGETGSTVGSADHAAPASQAAGQQSRDRNETDQESDDVTQLGSVKVTAQSRSQEAEDVPIAMQIVDAHSIRTHAATDISKMDIFVPGLVVDAGQPTQPSYQLRGIGGSGFGIGADPAVGVYVDGVYTARSGAAMLAFNDVKRIEVLKGPQGTLFGRNAAAGAISIVTNEPSDHFEARGRIRVGNHGTRHGDALLNVPAGENMAFRLNVIDNQSRGWARDAASGRHYAKDDDWGSRLSWRWNVGSNTQLLVNWEHERLKQPPQAAYGLIPLSGDPYQRAPYPSDPSTFLDPLHAPLYNDAVGGLETRRYDSLTMHITHYMDWATLTSISSYRHFNTLNRTDWDGTNHIVTYLDSANVESNRSLYQEFKLSGNTRLADWVVGASWYKEDGRQTSETRFFTDSVDTLILNLGVPTGTPDGTLYNYFDSLLQAYGLPYSVLGDPWAEHIKNHLQYTSYAVYGDVIWHLNDRVNLTTGARFTRDSKDFSWFNAPRIAPELDQTIDALNAMGLLAQAGVDPSVFRQNLVFPNAVGIPVQDSDSWTDFSPRVVLDGHFTDNVMGYISVAKGYKAGGYDSVEVGSRFEPEKVWNYEAGIKTVFPEQRVVLNASVYHYRYSNLQSLRLDPNTAGSGVPRYVADSSDQKADGAEIEVQWEPSDALLLHGNVAYIDSVFGHKTAASGADLSGQPTGIPEYSYSLGMQYVWHLAGGRLLLNIDHAYRGHGRCNSDSKLQGTCQISPNFSVNNSYSRTDARLGWTAPGDHWGAALYVNNLFDKRYVEGVNNVSATVLGTPFATISPPRMYGLELEVKY